MSTAKDQQEIYVVVAENDKPHIIGGESFADDGGPLILEQYVRLSDLESVKKRIGMMRGNYGKCRIARLEFIENQLNNLGDEQ